MSLRDQRLIFTKGQIDRAGQDLVSSNILLDESLQVLNNYRTCHGYPLNTFQATLRVKLKRMKIESIVSQRLKRIPSMILKLKRFGGMRLSRMQDVGGLRAIVAKIEDVDMLTKDYIDTSWTHELASTKDYIKQPKDSGYRSVHFVYKYRNPVNANYDGLMIELQIRTKLQHAWATAVETVGTFIDHSLKSSQGPEEWLNFFALVSHAFAYKEGTPGIPKFSKLDEKKTHTLIRLEARRLKVEDQLNAFRLALNQTINDRKQGSLYLIILDLSVKQVTIQTYSKAAIELATKDYLKEETLNADGRHVVLVSSSSLDALHKSYPSYFLDTQEFLDQLTSITSKH